ncbi:MAG: hypothetical protein D6713_01555 [Deltaproteobacteria bacterium]|nr:MAG: hypothetical protein D6713_01555 [Deltaproteobacteria bacterium]
MKRRREKGRTDPIIQSERFFAFVTGTLVLSFIATLAVLSVHGEELWRTVSSSSLVIHLCHAFSTAATSLLTILRSGIVLFVLFLVPFGLVGFFDGLARGAFSAFSFTEKVTRKGRERLDFPASVPVFAVDSNHPIAFTAGIFRKRIFVSRKLVETLTHNELRCILLHEEGHVRLNHTLKRLILRNLLRPLLFIPGRKRIYREYQILTELAADRFAVTRGTDPILLAETLLKVAKMCRSAGPAVLPGFSGKEVSTRVAALVEGRTRRKWVRGVFACAAASLALLLSLAAAPTITPASNCLPGHGKSHSFMTVSFCAEIECGKCSICSLPLP